MVASAERQGEPVSSHYPFKPGPYSSHTLLLRSLPAEALGRRVLDIGAGEGHLARELAKRGYEVVAIDKPGPARPPSDNGIHFLEADLDFGMPRVPGPFSFIICGDVLEHLRDPLKLLAEIGPLLEPGGRLIASLPNSGNIYFRLNVLFGRFPPDERGLFDRTHLRFYTWSGWRELFQKARYRLENVAPTGIPVGLALPRWDKTFPVRLAERLCYDLARIWKTLFAYQFVVVARPEGAP